MASSFLWHTQEVDSVAHELKTDLEQGLSSKEAASRLAIYGPNELPETEHIPWAKILFRQQISLMIPILVLASVLLILAQMWGGAFAVIGILIVTIIVNGFQALRSEKLQSSFKKLANRSMYARVLRSSHEKLVKTTDLVPGEIICFEMGDRIPADGRLMEAENLSIDESPIMRTVRIAEKDVGVLGEDTPIHQRKNVVFMGTIVTSGNGRAIVTSTGIQTQIAGMSAGQTVEPEKDHWSLLEANLWGRGLWFAAGCIVCAAVLWIIMMIAGAPTLAGVLVALSFLIAAWPMGLVEAITMALTIGMKRLSERQIAIRNFSGAEALAGATAICSDKSGIMTQKLMIVNKVFVDGHIIDIEGDGYDPESGGFPPDAEEESPDLPLLLTVASMCANTEVKNTPEGWDVIGDPTEGALIVAAMKGGINKDELGLSLTKVAELPFDSERKRMTTVYKSSKDELFVFTKGSLETVLDICSNIQLHGYMDDLDIGRQRAVWAVNQSFARDEMQSMAFAYCQLKDEPEEYTVKTVERYLSFVGMAGIVDPMRADAKSAVEKCLTGAVQPIMLTDDYVDTAYAIAHELGMVKDGSEVLAGEELDILAENEYSRLAERFSVYADVSPTHKIRIIRTLKEKGAVIAVIGSHTSDAAVLEEADIGIAAGQTSSSVATDASDMVLMDNSFATAVDAIEVMRGAYGNARKIIRYLLSGSAATAGAILLILIISIFQREFSLTSPSTFHMLILHVLWINLVAGIIPALAMAFSPVTDGVMKEGPYLRGKILDDGLRNRIPTGGILAAFLALIAFVFSLGPADQGRAVTAALTVLVVSQIAFVFQCRATPDEGFFRKYLTSKLLLGLASFAILLQISVIYISPISQVFRTESLLLTDWIPILVAFVVCSLPLDELFNARVEEEEVNERRDDEEEVVELSEVAEENTPMDTSEELE
ncbi:cation-translocating P-type ATPase [Candidatus Poribacteria bacterium]